MIRNQLLTRYYLEDLEQFELSEEEFNQFAEELHPRERFTSGQGNLHLPIPGMPLNYWPRVVRAS